MPLNSDEFSTSSPQQQPPPQRGGVLYITDPPPTLDFGIDCMHYETGAKFRGVSMIPKGIHFVYHSTGMGSRQGFFLIYEKDTIVVKSWDTRNEDIAVNVLLPENSLQSLLLSINCGQQDHFLGPYPLQQHSSWLNLSNYMTLSTLQRAGVDFHTPIYPGDAEDIPNELLSKQNNEALTAYFPDTARVAQFCDIKLIEQNLRNSITTSSHMDTAAKSLELSRLYLDNSSILENVVAQYFDDSWEELLGEVQLSFMLFMLIFSFPALQQWKALVNMICNSERILLSRPNFTACFVRLFYEQLQYSPDDFFETEISSDNFLKPAITNLFESLDSQSLPQSLDAMRKRLFAFIQKKFNLYVDEGNLSNANKMNLNKCEGSKFNLLDEDMPVIVYPDNPELVAEWNKGKADPNSKRVSFSDGLSNENDGSFVHDKWNEIDVALDNISCVKIDHDNEIEFAEMMTSASAIPQSSCIPETIFNSGGVSTGSTEESIKTSLELQANMFCWRYPLLYDEMMKNNSNNKSSENNLVSIGQEDLTMTAMRIIETFPADNSGEQTPSTLLRAEAIKFVRDEMSLWQNEL